jgi:LytS/YehU family sensor histidine kinase
VVFPLAGLGAYDYGIMRLRYPMELSIHVLIWSLLVVLIHLFDYYRAARARELQLAQLETKLVRAQLQTLRLQLQPHFLFNALNTISSILYDDVRAADRMIARLSEFLRLTLRASEAQEVTLRQELEFLELYLEIMRTRFEDRLKVDFAVAPETLEAMTPQLILQPLVENSIKHAADPVSGHVKINVSARREKGSLWLEVSDNGPGLQTSRAQSLKEGFGLTNTIERLQQLYRTAQALALDNATPSGLRVRVKIPFHTTQQTNNLQGGAADVSDSRSSH